MQLREYSTKWINNIIHISPEFFIYHSENIVIVETFVC